MGILPICFPTFRWDGHSCLSSDALVGQTFLSVFRFFVWNGHSGLSSDAVIGGGINAAREKNRVEEHLRAKQTGMSAPPRGKCPPHQERNVRATKREMPNPPIH